MLEPANAALIDWLRSAKTRLRDGYRMVSRHGRSHCVHRLVWEAWHGPIPAGHVVHHVNHKRDDNRIENLRVMTSSDHSRLHHKKARCANWERGQRYATLKRHNLCTRCLAPSDRDGFALCIKCSGLTVNASARSAAKYLWLAHPESRTCPRCRRVAACEIAERVCVNCICTHLMHCQGIPGPRPRTSPTAVPCMGPAYKRLGISLPLGMSLK